LVKLGFLLLRKNYGIYRLNRRALSCPTSAFRCLNSTKDFVLNGQKQLQESKAGKLLAEDLRQVQHALGEITGFVSSDALLGKTFSSSCIEK